MLSWDSPRRGFRTIGWHILVKPVIQTRRLAVPLVGKCVCSPTFCDTGVRSFFPPWRVTASRSASTAYQTPRPKAPVIHLWGRRARSFFLHILTFVLSSGKLCSVLLHVNNRRVFRWIPGNRCLGKNIPALSSVPCNAWVALSLSRSWA